MYSIRMFMFALTVALGLSLAGCVPDGPHEDTTTSDTPPQVGTDNMSPKLMAAEVINNYKPAILPPLGSAAAEYDAAKLPVVRSVADWRVTFNRQVATLSMTQSWPMRVVKRVEMVSKHDDVKVTLTFQQIGDGWDSFTVAFMEGGAAELWTDPFGQIQLGDRVYVDLWGWPHKIVDVWVKGDKYGYKPAPDALIEPVPAEMKVQIPLG